MNALLIYLVLTAAGRWEFLAIERVPDLPYCEVLRDSVAGAFENRPGNMRILCADDEEVAL